MTGNSFHRLRADFPLLARPVRGRRLAYLDSAATTQKPTEVIEALRRYYREDNANTHRGVHYLSDRATELYEAPPRKYEAGTPNVEGAVGLAAALDYLERIGMKSIGAQEAALLDYATARVGEIGGLRVIGTARASFALYNDRADVDQLVEALWALPR